MRCSWTRRSPGPGRRRRRLDRGVGASVAPDLHHPRPRRPLVRRYSAAETVPRGGGASDRRHHATHGRPKRQRVPRGIWDRVFPGQLPSGDVDVDVVGERGFELEGVPLVPVEVGHTDTDATTMLHVPQSDSSSPATSSTTACISTSPNLAARRHRRVAHRARHSRGASSRRRRCRPQEPEAFDNPSQIRNAPISDRCARLLESSARAREFYDGMLAAHPNRINPGALWGAAITLLPEP